MTKEKKIQYEKIAVLAICICNMEDMIFEINEIDVAWGYARLAEVCIGQMKKEKGLKQLLLNEEGLIGIFENDSVYLTGRMKDCAERIKVRIREMSGKFAGNDKIRDQRWMIGLGLTAGIGCRVEINNEEDVFGALWMGPVFERAKAFARQSVCDGSGQIITKS